MMTEQRRVIWLLAIILTVPGLAYAVREGRLIGKVVDREGKPILGVKVTVTSPDIARFMEVKTTNKKGVFKVDFDTLHVVYHYRFEKPGYQTTEANQAWSFQGTKRHEFTMPPGDSSMVGLPPASSSNPAILAFNAGIAAFEAEDHATAQAKLEESLGHDPELRQAWEVLSVVHLDQKHHQEAADAAEKAMALGSTDASILRSRWEAYRNLGDEAKTAEARLDLERLGRLSEEAKRIYNQGVSLSKAGDEEGAFATFQVALEADPNLQQALLAVATTGLKLDRAAEAAAAAETILEANPQHEQALRIRYNASLKLGEEVRLIDALVGLALVDPVMAREGLFQLATAAFDADDPVKAKERFGKVLEIDPNHPRSHYFLGLILVREQANEEAQSHLERFLALAPDDPDAATAGEILKVLKAS